VSNKVRRSVFPRSIGRDGPNRSTLVEPISMNRLNS